MEIKALTLLGCLSLFSTNQTLAADQTQEPATPLQSKKALLVQWMQGHFNSEQQSIDDKDFFNIHLNMKQIWPQYRDSWLYVEQAAASHLYKPYRQRVYRVTALSETKFASKVYTFDNPLSFAGAYKKEAPFASLTPKDLTEKQGCTVFLTWDEASQSFSGSTDKKSCLSQLRGATYATSEVTVTADKIVSWDRGWNGDDQQVWGAVKSGYEFLKR
ncbi:chromophore lyase CpcT/CpeT [Shewanella gelidii]|uniref:Chromophore lyase CpcT/CpeT 2 n=1 Tax=Shewanella gelidii TaxID=1642821 RepID=A0A917NC30_9GAMM|nr:chromophore lyase CpcT/CpeT [Shewanella gelidii]MCL1098429.1 chromophore lyase CpcT/CpeT [Shewanella gelidii]GGI82784.1 chromophore lyase CpcT/CpeT 2 [Shewanella gelidii]